MGWSMSENFVMHALCVVSRLESCGQENVHAEVKESSNIYCILS